MKTPLVVAITAFVLFVNFFAPNAAAQSINDSSVTKNSIVSDLDGTNSATVPDDEFNIFLFVLATVFISVMIGGAIIGAFAATLMLLSLLGLVSLGILSVSVIAGLYKRSFQTGFKTFLVIVCTLGGIIFGTVGFWLIVKLAELKVSNTTIFISGTVSGGLGGVILGVIVYNLILISMKYCRRRLNFAQ